MPWFTYSKIDDVPLPLLSVRLWHGNQNVPLIGLVDSGADASLFDVQYAYELGLELSQAQVIESRGADGKTFNTFLWPKAPLELQFQGDRFAFRGFFADFPEDADGQNLLGRRDFFQRYIIQFYVGKELMNVDLSPDFAEGPITP